LFFELPSWEFWRCTPELHRRLFVEDVHGGTLVYRRQVWGHGARYPDASLGEDAVFLRQAVRRGARLCRLANSGQFIYLRHGRNSWAFSCGRYLDPRGWQRAAEPAWPDGDRDFYAGRSPAAPGPAAAPPPRPAAPSQPLVSCIMPTANRRPFVPQALRYFLRQDYPNRELIVVDDGPDAVGDLLPSDTRVRYIRLAGRKTVGAKRNLACQQAAGEIIVHWDDDDWMAGWRLSYQVASLLNERAEVCGLATLLHYDPAAGAAWRYVYPTGGRPWVAGNTLCYTRRFWNTNPFPDINVGEDTRFLWSNRPKKILPLADERFYVALIHPSNTSPKQTGHARWSSCPADVVMDLLGADTAFYAGLLGKERAAQRRAVLPAY
jgi:hypothetical protein